MLGLLLRSFLPLTRVLLLATKITRGANGSMVDAPVKKKILVVDDDLMAVALMSRTLLNMGFEVLKG